MYYVIRVCDACLAAWMRRKEKVSALHQSSCVVPLADLTERRDSASAFYHAVKFSFLTIKQQAAVHRLESMLAHAKISMRHKKASHSFIYIYIYNIHTNICSCTFMHVALYHIIWTYVFAFACRSVHTGHRAIGTTEDDLIKPKIHHLCV